MIHFLHCLIEKLLFEEVFLTLFFESILLILERENEQVPAKLFQKGPFSTVYTKWLDALMT